MEIESGISLIVYTIHKKKFGHNCQNKATEIKSVPTIAIGNTKYLNILICFQDIIESYEGGAVGTDEVVDPRVPDGLGGAVSTTPRLLYSMPNPRPL